MTSATHKMTIDEPRSLSKPLDGGKFRLLTMSALDGRTLAVQRAKNQIESLEQQLGGAATLSSAKTMLVRYSAFVDLYIEDIASRFIGGKNFKPPPEWFVAIGVQRRNLQALGLEQATADEHAPLTPDQIADKKADGDNALERFITATIIKYKLDNLSAAEREELEKITNSPAEDVDK